MQFTAEFNEAQFSYDPENDPGEAVLGVDSCVRMNALLALKAHLTKKEWFSLLGKYWSECDDVGRYANELRYILKSARLAYIDSMMNDEERAARDALPPTFSAWRGCYELNRHGLSYSIDRRIAEEFPFKARYRLPEQQPILLKAKIRRSRAIVKLARGEREVIAIDPKIVETEALMAAPKGRPFVVIRMVHEKELRWNDYWDLVDAEAEVQSLNATGRAARIEDAKTYYAARKERIAKEQA